MRIHKVEHRAPWTVSGTSHRVCYLQVSDVHAHPLRHGVEALELGVVQEDVDRHSSERRTDDLFEYVNIGEDVHRYGNNLRTCHT